MSEPKEVKPLDMTSDEAVEFLFPKEAIERLKQAANPQKVEVSKDEDDCDERPYTHSS